LVEGVLAGYGIAIPVGPIAVLIMDTAVRRGFAPAAVAGLGAATADLLYASLAAFAGGAAAVALRPYDATIRVVGALVIAAIALARIRTLRRPPAGASEKPRARSILRTYATFLGLTLANPSTVVYFAALILGARAELAGPGRRVGFALAAFAASASWQLGLAGVGTVLHHRLGERARMVTGVLGSVILISLAIKIALGA